MPDLAAGCVSCAAAVAMPAQDQFHLIFELKLAFLESGFFELLGLREVVPAGEGLNLFVEVVM
jgi:hypothetical protein